MVGMRVKGATDPPAIQTVEQRSGGICLPIDVLQKKRRSVDHTRICECVDTDLANHSTAKVGCVHSASSLVPIICRHGRSRYAASTECKMEPS